MLLLLLLVRLLAFRCLWLLSWLLICAWLLFSARRPARPGRLSLLRCAFLRPGAGGPLRPPAKWYAEALLPVRRLLVCYLLRRRR